MTSTNYHHQHHHQSSYVQKSKPHPTNKEKEKISIPSTENKRHSKRINTLNIPAVIHLQPVVPLSALRSPSVSVLLGSSASSSIKDFSLDINSAAFSMPNMFDPPRKVLRSESLTSHLLSLISAKEQSIPILMSSALTRPFHLYPQNHVE